LLARKLSHTGGLLCKIIISANLSLQTSTLKHQMAVRLGAFTIKDRISIILIAQEKTGIFWTLTL
jgi:hypothetical protein